MEYVETPSWGFVLVSNSKLEWVDTPWGSLYI